VILCMVVVMTILIPLEKEGWRVPVIVLMSLVTPLYFLLFSWLVSVSGLLWGGIWLSVASVAVMIRFLMKRAE